MSTGRQVSAVLIVMDTPGGVVAVGDDAADGDRVSVSGEPSI
jgi:hypothetical protein